MRAFMMQTADAPPRLTETARPDPGPGEVRIRVAACGLNFADLLMIAGKYQDTPALPFTLGMEIAGTVEVCGPDVQAPAPGTRVAAFIGAGGLADHAVCDAARCTPLPATMTMIEGAGFQIAYGTSHLGLAHRARLQPGETLLVLGAAGGVGLTAVEIGAQMGARVVAVARGAEKLEVARAAGAEVLIDSAAESDLRATFKALGGIDVVYDAVGEPAASAALRALRPEGRFLAIGFAGGEVPRFPANLLLVKNISVLGLYWGGYLRFAPQVLTDSLAELMRWHAEGRLHPHVSHVLPLVRVAEGLDLLKARKATGKVVITMEDPEDQPVR